MEASQLTLSTPAVVTFFPLFASVRETHPFCFFRSYDVLCGGLLASKGGSFFFNYG